MFIVDIEFSLQFAGATFVGSCGVRIIINLQCYDDWPVAQKQLHLKIHNINSSHNKSEVVIPLQSECHCTCFIFVNFYLSGQRSPGQRFDKIWFVFEQHFHYFLFVCCQINRSNSSMVTLSLKVRTIWENKTASHIPWLLSVLVLSFDIDVRIRENWHTWSLYVSCHLPASRARMYRMLDRSMYVNDIPGEYICSVNASLSHFRTTYNPYKS